MSIPKRIASRVFYTLFPSRRKSQVDILIQNGNLKVGKNCDLRGLNIKTYRCRPGNLNIVIGDDCHLMGNIVLYDENARVTIGDRVFVGPDTNLIALNEIEIENDILISWGCTIMDNNSHSLHSAERATDVVDWKNGWEHKKWDVVDRRKIRIEKKSWIGFNSIILKGVEIKEGTIVASGSVVTKTFEPYSIIGGNPAQFIKKSD